MSTPPPSLVSVVIAVYNGERYLGDAIDSVLAQSYQPLDVIVVDDGSTDGSAQVARSFGSGVSVLVQDHAGAGPARNRGVDAARGAYLSFLDADDLWLPDKLTLQMRALDAEPTLELVFGQVEQFRSPDLPDDLAARAIPPGLELMNGLVAGALLARRAAFKRVGPFGTRWRVGDFVDWYIRAMDLGLHSATLPEIVMRRRWHTANLTLRERHALSEYAHIIKESLDRRRGRAKPE